ncbi:MAG: hypothetical protein JO362_20335 [Streptomycetaceae bacterium]|nr:hypothetical protein [Streptomycetaceae bacterium]
MGRSTGGSAAAGRRARPAIVLVAALAMLVLLVPGTALASGQAKRHTGHVRRTHRHFTIRKHGELDCNGYSRRQVAIRADLACTDIRGLRGVSNDWTWHGRFFDNGHYIGHDEPDMTFLSSAAGSGNNVIWTETLPLDPSAAPTVGKPGSDVTHWFELSPAPWFSMAQCDSNSYPQLPCSPMSDENAPSGKAHGYPGAGGAFMEMQFYPPGFPPFADGVSCNDTQWCAALNIDSLECTLGFAHCNPNCTEPVNFAYIQTDGVPAGPPSPQKTNLSTFTPNGKTLLMNPGDHLWIHMWDAPVPGHPGQMAFKVEIKDLTSGKSGYMQASAENGFQNTSIVDCSGTPHNFEPEYNTAKQGNITPWAALRTDISTEYETGHFEPCTKVTDPIVISLFGMATDTVWTRCSGPYEAAGGSDSGSPEISDASCFPAGDTHGTLNTAPDEVTGCQDNLSQNGDLDFDGTPYWPDWPTSTTPGTFPGSFQQALPVTLGRQYGQYFMQTDLALSESTCSAGTPAGCAVPPPNAPGQFYPYWSRTGSGDSCTILFGNVSGPGIATMGKQAQYGTNQAATVGYPEFEGAPRSNAKCT